MKSRARPPLRVVARGGPLAALAAGLMSAASCTEADRIVGEDFVSEDAGVADADGGSLEASADGSLGPDARATACSGTCLPSGAACIAFSAAETCSEGYDCCVEECLETAPPSPAFCDGGPRAALYVPHGCVAGYACAPVACESAGGACVPSGTCAGNRTGGSSTYVCDESGTVCCLP